MPHKAPPRPILTFALALAAATGPLAQAQTIPDVPPEIVSAWKLNGQNFLAVFTHDGTFYTIQDNATAPGFERGSFTWNKTTQAFNAQTIVDTNGDEGFSHPEGATSISINGDTLSYTVAGDGTYSFTRVVNTASAIVGSWYVPGGRISVTFLADGTYYLAEEPFAPEDGHVGMERGTYSWNATTKSITTTQLVDTKILYGLSDLPGGSTINVAGNVMVFNDTEEATTLRRITPIANPLNTGNDFEVDKFANHRQTSNSPPTLLTGSPSNTSDDFPFWGEAFIDSGTGGILSITGKQDIAFVVDVDEDGDDSHSWSIETEYVSLNSLNLAFPNGANYVFTQTGGSATLSYPAGGAFPPGPQIQIGEGAWSGGKYLLGSNQTLTWNPHTGYDASTLVTVISVVDQADGTEIFYEEVIQGDVTSYDLSGEIAFGHTYDVQLEHVRIASSTTSGTGSFAGKLGYALYNSNTRFEMVAPTAPDAPAILEQPASQAGNPGEPLVISVGINLEAYPSSTFQWFKNDEEIPGQTGNSLFIRSFDPVENSGRYHVVVTNLEGTAVSDVATLEKIGVTVLGINRRRTFTQQTATTLAASGANLTVYVEGGGISPTFPSTSMNVSKPNGTLLPLVFDEDRWAIDTDFSTETNMLTSYPNGAYQIKIGNDSIPVSIGAGSYPSQPTVASSVGAWSQGKLQITASQAAAGFTLTTNASNGDGYRTLNIIHEIVDEDVFYIRGPDSPSAGIVANIPANLLQPGSEYQVEVEFDEIIYDYDASNFEWAAASPTTTAFGILSSETFVTIEIVADPPGTPYTTWQAGFFNPTQLANPAISGDNADFDNDGVGNLLEYLLGGNPTLTSSGLLPTITKAPGSNNLVFSYKRKVSATGVTQIIEHATNLSPPWTAAVHGQNGVSIVTALVPGDSSTEQVTVTIPSTSTSRFVRLKVVR